MIQNERYSRYLLPTFIISIIICGGPGSSVSIATDYGLDGPASNPGGDEIFRPSRLGLGPGAHAAGRAADHSPPSSAAVMEE